MQERTDITRLLENGKIDDSTFQILNDRISQYFDELDHDGTSTSKSVTKNEEEPPPTDIPKESKTILPNRIQKYTSDWKTSELDG